MLGVALIGIGWAAGAFTAAASAFAKQLVIMGAGMALTGISQMISPAPTLDTGTSEGAATKQSYIFSGGANIAEEGNIIPLVYGKFWTGSLVLSAGMKPVNDLENVQES